jgi:cell division protein FtsB
MGLWGKMIKKQIKGYIVKSGTYKVLEREKNIIKDENKKLKTENNILYTENKKLLEKTKNLEEDTKNLIDIIHTNKENKLNLLNYINELNDKIEHLKRNNNDLKLVIKNLKGENRSLKQIYLNDDIPFSPDYNKFTVILPYCRTDDPDREQNLDITLRYLSSIGIKNLIISEHSKVSYERLLMEEYGDLFDSFKVISNNSDKNIFNTSLAINRGVIESETSYFAIFDADCLTEKKNIDMAINLLDNGYELVHPFNRIIKDISDKEKFKEEYDFKTVKSKTQYRDMADGGIVFWNKESFIDIGMENEYFNGWGGEDNEILVRASLSQIKQIRIDDILYHLYHERPLEKSENNLEQIKKIEKIVSKEDLLDEINKWPWVESAKKNLR